MSEQARACVDYSLQPRILPYFGCAAAEIPALWPGGGDHLPVRRLRGGVRGGQKLFWQIIFPTSSVPGCPV